MLKDKDMHKIPEKHTLKLLQDKGDFCFINKLLEKSYCKYYGRPAKEPELMVKIFFSGPEPSPRYIYR